MVKIKKPLIICVATTSIVTGIVAASLILGIGSDRQIKLYSCGNTQGLEYISKAGPEYIIVNPSIDFERNSFLVSRETSIKAQNWLLLGMPVAKATEKGFKLKSIESKPYIRDVTFDSETLKLKINYGITEVLPVTTICKPSRELGKIQKIANNVPVEYLLNRQSSMYFLNPRLGQRSFNTTLYNAIRLKKHSTYGVYQLLSSLPENMLTGNESLVMKEARDELIKANTMQSEIWVFSGTYRYYWEYPNEKEEANTNANNWCKRQNGDMDELTSKGYKTEKSVPESRSTNGWVRQDYPNGEFQGYVNFKAQCDGATYTMIKKGTVDTESENTSRRLDYEGRNI